MNRLGERVAPWLKIHLTGEPSIAQITSTVDRIVYDDGIKDKVSGFIHMTRPQCLDSQQGKQLLLNSIFFPVYESFPDRGYRKNSKYWDTQTSYCSCF